ncbi:biotin synthetase [Salmonella enterica subsp. enterica]|uniref:Biotin synthetase n=1 Tax=Salmonella enterica I TaxID=59201 RepID=A0A3S4IMQ4_SALET|nr:biotin synthetase [Salmonella enterica subsp. enterica]
MTWMRLILFRTIAVARIMMPTSYVRLSAGREQMNEQTQAMCFYGRGELDFSMAANC